MRLSIPSIGLDPKNAIFFVFLAMSYEQKRSFNEAIAEYQMVLADDASNIVALGGAAYAHLLIGKRTEAKACWLN